MKLLVADDHPLFRSGLRHVLLRLADKVEIIEADDHAQAVAAASAHADLSLVLLDLHMPGCDGLEALQGFVRRFALLPVVVLSASEDRKDMQRAFDAGAAGFIQKSTPAPVILSALRLVLEGGIYVPPALVQTTARPPQASAHLNELTPRQHAVLARVIEGKSNRVIAGELGLTEATVKAHVTGVFKTLRVSNRTQAAIAAGKITPAA